MRFVALGDSYTIGTSVAEGERWPDQLVARVPQLELVGNAAVNGYTSADLIENELPLLDGVASIAYAAALGPGVALSALTVLVVQGGIAGAAFLLRDVMDPATILAITAAGGVILLAVTLRLLELKAVRVASFLPALLLAPIFIRLAGLVREALGA